MLIGATRNRSTSTSADDNQLRPLNVAKPLSKYAAALVERQYCRVIETILNTLYRGRSAAVVKECCRLMTITKGGSPHCRV